MTPLQLKYRADLLTRHDAALYRWPQGKSPDFIREVAAIAAGLETLAREADALGGDPLERSRTWRYVGNAYQDLSVGQGGQQLRKAADAYQGADALLTRIADPIERMKLDFSYGRVLIRLSEGMNVDLVQAARDRFVSALALARTHMPEGAAEAERALADAEAGLAIVQTVANYDRRIGELKEELAGSQSPSQPSGWPAEFQGYLAQLQRVYQQDIQAGKVSASHQEVLDQVLDELGNMLKYRPDDLAGKINQSSQLRELWKRMAPFRGETGQGVLAPDSRAKAVWRRFSAIKIAVAQEMVQPNPGSETQFCAGDLFLRCGHADTYIHQYADDDRGVREYERDVLRALALEARTFSLRNHLMLAQPIWPSPPLAQDPNGIFYSGRATLQPLVAEACQYVGLNLLPEWAARDYASARWEQLRNCHVAVFDYTGYRTPVLDQPLDLSVGGSLAAISYELGIALALGRVIVVIAYEGQELPFDIDIHPLRLKGDEGDKERMAEALDDAVYSLPRGVTASSLPATQAYLEQSYAGHEHVIVAQSLKLIDQRVMRDPVQFRRLIEPLLGTLGPDAPQIVFPAWPGSYPQVLCCRMFHVTAFGPPWANDTMSMAARSCASARPAVQYVRGDQPLDPDIIGSIWDNLCQATHVLVDLTGLNSNVALELGIAHTLGRNVLLVTQDDSVARHFPAIAKLRIHRYSLDGKPGIPRLPELVDRYLESS